MLGVTLKSTMPSFTYDSESGQAVETSTLMAQNQELQEQEFNLQDEAEQARFKRAGQDLAVVSHHVVQWPMRCEAATG